jgi:microsomal dipeptidase-like Zn-dependent dipeptidase
LCCGNSTFTHGTLWGRHVTTSFSGAAKIVPRKNQPAKKIGAAWQFSRAFSACMTERKKQAPTLGDERANEKEKTMNLRYKFAISLLVFLGFIIAETGLSPIEDNVSAKTNAAQCDYGPDTCLPGYVWREAYPGDRVCVTGPTRAQAAADNAQAAARRDPQGPYGPDTCLPGYVWREATLGDHVCVLPSVREQTAQDNRTAASRRDPNCAPIWGWADLHTHPFAYEGFGGSGSVLYGKAYGPRNAALAQCDSVHGLGGVNDLVGMVMHGFYTGRPQWGHRTDGNPGFAGWPRWDDVTHQAMHEESLKRAVDGGLRLMVAHAVNNEWMCATAKGVNMTAANLAAAAAFATGGPSAAVATLTSIIGAQAAGSQAAFLAGNVPAACKDMPSVDRQISEAYAMQSSIDTRSGGPGLGWFRIVKDPTEAISVMRQGKLAVILGIEVDNLFNCYANGGCTEATVRQQLDRYFAMGVRHVFPIHFYDNAFGGSANGNVLISNQFKAPLAKETCQNYPYAYDRNQCNSKGLSRLGEFLIRELALRGMIIDTDHMSAHSFNNTLNILEPLGYPVLSGHVGFNEITHGDKNHEGNRTPSEVQRIQRVNGLVAVITHQGDLNEISTEPIHH